VVSGRKRTKMGIDNIQAIAPKFRDSNNKYLVMLMEYSGEFDIYTLATTI